MHRDQSLVRIRLKSLDQALTVTVYIQLQDLVDAEGAPIAPRRILRRSIKSPLFKYEASCGPRPAHVRNHGIKGMRSPVARERLVGMEDVQLVPSRGRSMLSDVGEHPPSPL